MRGKPEYPAKNLSEQSREPTTNSTHVWHRVRESNPGHIGGRRALSLLRQPCSTIQSIFDSKPHVLCKSARQLPHFFKKMTILNTFISPFSSKPRKRVLRLLPGICFFFIEIFTILHYANEKSDDVIGGSTKTVQHSINNVSRIIKAVFFKLGTMYITKERKWHSLCHDNSNAAGAALIKIFIPRFYLK